MTCSIYTNSHYPNEILTYNISKLLDGKVLNQTFISTNEMFIGIKYNDEYNTSELRNFPDGFLFFKQIIEIDIKNFTDNIYINNINKILIYLWSSNIPAVASCDFENYLTNNGGYNSMNTPWP